MEMTGLQAKDADCDIGADCHNDEGPTNELDYDVDEMPPLPIAFAVAFQHLINSIACVAVVTYTISDVICLSSNDPIRSGIFSSSLFMVGLATIVQTLIGVRLPVFQGPAFSFLPPVILMKTSGAWVCPVPDQGLSENVTGNLTTTETNNYVLEETKFARLNEIQGSLILASVAEVILGATGTIGILLRFIGPITISVTIFLLGYSLYPVPIYYSSSYLPVAASTVAVLVILGIYMAPVRITLPGVCRRNRARTRKGYPVLRMTSILLTTVVMWIVCWVLTFAGVFTDDPTEPSYNARTDTRNSLIETTPWFYFPYPGQFGAPKLNTALFVGFLSVVIASATESCGDYFATASTCQATPVPSHAVNRGILTEGIMSVLSASLGTGHATTSYTMNVAIVAITKVGSRYVLAIAGFICLLMAIIGKLGAVMSSMPYPIIGGVTLVTIGIVLSLGLTSLSDVDMKSSRNISVIGVSIITAITSSEWLSRNPGKLKTGYSQLDQVLEVILGFPMIAGGLIAIILDNTVKGNRKERGLDLAVNDVTTNSHKNHTHNKDKAGNDVTRRKLFDIPYINQLLGRWKYLRYLPFVQNFSYEQINHSAV